jgi:hypothetical protein
MLIETEPVKRKQECIEKGICDIPLLGNFTNDNVTSAYHTMVETNVINQIKDAFGCGVKFNSFGEAAFGDITLMDNTLIEVKIRSFNGSFFLETGKITTSPDAKIIHKTPKGLDLSASNYYVILQPGKFGGVTVLKVRVVPTPWLREYRNITVEHLFGNSVGVNINWSDIDFEDGWVGSFAYNEDAKTFKLNSFKPGYKQIKNICARHNGFKNTGRI